MRAYVGVSLDKHALEDTAGDPIYISEQSNPFYL
jgi:hypothetical protein